MQMEYAPIKAHECDQYREQKQKSREEEIARFQQEFAANTEQLRNYMEAHGLRSVDPSGESPPLWCFLGIHLVLLAWEVQLCCLEQQSFIGCSKSSSNRRVGYRNQTLL